jgi:hypothetical protein
VDVQVVAGGDRADAVENVFRQRGPRDRVNDDISVGKDTVYGFRDFVGDLARALESHAAGEADRDVGKVAVAGAADADAVHFEKAIDAAHGVDDAAAGPGGCSVEEGVNRLAGEAGADKDDHPADEQRGNGVGVDQPRNAVTSADEDQSQPQGNHAAGPDVGGEMQGVGLQGLAIVFVGDLSQPA